MRIHIDTTGRWADGYAINCAIRDAEEAIASHRTLIDFNKWFDWRGVPTTREIAYLVLKVTR